MLKTGDIVDHRHWGHGVVVEVGEDTGKCLRAGTVKVQFINGPEDWNLWVINDDCDKTT